MVIWGDELLRFATYSYAHIPVEQIFDYKTNNLPSKMTILGTVISQVYTESGVINLITYLIQGAGDIAIVLA